MRFFQYCSFILLIYGIISCDDPRNVKIYSMDQVDTIPEYPGGLTEFYGYLNRELSNPSPRDTIFLLYRFEVNRSGIVENTSVLNGYGDEFDKKVQAALKNSKKWRPGVKENKEVTVFLDLPFVFLPSQ